MRYVSDRRQRRARIKKILIIAMALFLAIGLLLSTFLGMINYFIGGNYNF